MGLPMYGFSWNAQDYGIHNDHGFQHIVSDVRGSAILSLDTNENTSTNGTHLVGPPLSVFSNRNVHPVVGEGF